MLNPQQVSQILLEAKAVHLQAKKENYYTWTSGIRSPIYCDNRKLISLPQQRELIINSFCEHIQQSKQDIDLIAGTATAGIPWAAWIAQKLALPMLYVRSKGKDHGLKNAIEGRYSSGQNVMLIEDLISTGKSSLAAAKELSQAQLKVCEVLAIFSYQTQKAQKTFEAEGLTFYSLSNFDALVNFARIQNLLTSEDETQLLAWRDNL